MTLVVHARRETDADYCIARLCPKDTVCTAENSGCPNVLALMQALLRFQVLVLLVYAGLVSRASASELGTQASEKVTGMGNANVGKSGNGQQSGVNHAW